MKWKLGPCHRQKGAEQQGPSRRRPWTKLWGRPWTLSRESWLCARKRTSKGGTAVSRVQCRSLSRAFAQSGSTNHLARELDRWVSSDWSLPPALCTAPAVQSTTDLKSLEKTMSGNSKKQSLNLPRTGPDAESMRMKWVGADPAAAYMQILYRVL